MPLRRSPSLFYRRYSDGLARAVAWTGVALAGAVVVGLVDLLPLAAAMLVWAALWGLYLSFITVGKEFFSFQWDALLLETGVAAILLAPRGLRPAYTDPPPRM